MLQELAEKQIQIKRLMKRNKKIEKSIRKRFATLDMDVDFDNQKCAIPFILAKVGEHPDYDTVEHDGQSKIQLHSLTPIECLGDAQVLNHIYPTEINNVPSTESKCLTRDLQKLSKYMPYHEFNQM